jgi:hypothetical protein
MTKEIRIHNGAPTLFLEGKPVFYGLMWGSAPEVDSYPNQECARLYAEAGVHIFTFDIGTSGPSPEWRGPRPDNPAPFDFSTLAQRLGNVIAADPLARFHLRVHMEMPEWWQKLYPDECEILSDGRGMCQSFASTLWRQQAKDFLTRLAEAVEAAGLSERIIAYQCGAGWTGEWVKGPGAMGLTTGDFSRPMREHFRAWLRARYHHSDAQLQAAWADPAVTFDTALVPEANAQFTSTAFTFRDPRKEQRVIDYFRCLAELCGDLIVDFCATVKQAARGNALAGAFYGYLTELAWNAGFFGEGLDSEFATYQRSGHLGLSRVLRSPAVDFLVSPHSYGLRGIGGDGCAMPPSESMRLHNKLYIFEDDTRTHLSSHDRFNYGKADDLAGSVALLRRNLAYVLTHGQGIWWLSGWNPQLPHIDPTREPAFGPLLAQFQRIGTWALGLERAPSAEVAVVVDDESFFYEWMKNDLDLPLIFQQRLWGLPHMGAPFDVYLLDDLLEQGAKPYRLYVFLNAFRLEKERREALKTVLRRDNQTALWVYAPGYRVEDETLETMRDLTGISFHAAAHPWGPLVHLTDLSHPITRGLSQDVSWGTNSRLGPVFHVEDADARSLGDVVLAQGGCRPGFALKEFPGWRSVYSAAPNLSAGVLRGIARYAGVHLYNEDGDTLYATPELLAVHTAAGGPRVLRLPRPVEIVYDVFERKVVAQRSDRFEITLPPATTSLFYTGAVEKLRGLGVERA